MEFEDVDISPSIMGLENQFLNAFILLDRWSKWSKDFGSFMYEQRDFVQLKKDTEEFFNKCKR